MGTTLPIGDFSRATHLSVKMLRHYHEIGLLEPVEIDASSGYRRYAVDQIPIAQVIRRFRELEMPLEDIRTVLNTQDPEARNQAISQHLARLEDNLARTQLAVASLRDLLTGPTSLTPVERHHVPPASTAAISETVHRHEALTWFHGALGELHATLAAQGISATGASGGIFAAELFTEDCGLASIFVPCERAPLRTGRVVPFTTPAADLATTIHAGHFDDIDRAYGALATYVTKHALAVDGPIRERYLVGPTDSADPTAWRTEIGWPIFNIGQS